ncbi:MAG: acetyl-CoA C-acyltransferase [Acidimicrobiia bacterium]|nr:acetyl-CoA C-acyltransferase [Acidimicrobiia bacterium]MBT8216992.1 acetyl-CoA C-acyltransferase [Acidimicrobiia bacterium]NNF10518.1 acetyl-CoA C-acyltransferase [Acidimicrobiia bacterium]NNL70085.1 acetyl-CoA C-acyltransferase [Acidimicrobiia bacterium]
MSETPRVAVVAGSRTPFAKAGAQLRKHRALDLGTHAVDGVLDAADINPEIVDTLVFGIVVVDARVPHLAREVTFSSRLPDSTRALTITDNCITSASGIELVVDSIRAGRAEVGIAGGVESMSNPSVLMSKKASSVFLQAASARSLGDRLKIFSQLRPKDLVPQAPGVAEPSTGLTMGEHCELMVKEWKISRQEQDEIAYRSHMNAAAATEDGRLTAEIAPLDGIDRDTMIRPETSMEKLAKLRTVFDPTPAGTLTAGNSSPLTDGAAAVMLMSEERARAEGLEPLAFVRDVEFVGINPADGLLMGPGVAVPRLLRRNGLDLDDMDIVEMHEAFGGQVACNLAAWEQGWQEPPIGKLDRTRLNPLGSSISIGHPFAATGARIVTTLANEMARREARYGLVSICGAGATAAALILER